jgi:hypothetical protein
MLYVLSNISPLFYEGQPSGEIFISESEIDWIRTELELIFSDVVKPNRTDPKTNRFEKNESNRTELEAPKPRSIRSLMHTGMLTFFCNRLGNFSTAMAISAIFQ